MQFVISFLKLVSQKRLTQDGVKNLMKQNSDVRQLIFQLIGKHKLDLVFYDLIKSLELEDSIDESIINRYSKELEVNNKKYGEYQNTIYPILKTLEQENVQYAILKGFSFMDELYKTSIGITRYFNDIDILIDKTDLKLAKEILNNHNFLQGKVVNGSIAHAKRKDLIYWELNSHQLHEYVKLSEYTSQYWIEIDINTTIFEGGRFVSPIETEILLSHSVMKKNEFGHTFLVLNATFSLIQLCYHFYKDTIYDVKRENHDDYSLIKFCDIHEFIFHYRNEIDWREFVKTVNESNIGNQIYYSLYLVSSFYGDLDIEDVLKEIKTTYSLSNNYIDWERMLLQK